MPKAFYVTGDISTGCQLSPMFLYQCDKLLDVLSEQI